jgi:hypothetical protein
MCPGGFLLLLDGEGFQGIKILVALEFQLGQSFGPRRRLSSSCPFLNANVGTIDAMAPPDIADETLHPGRATRRFDVFAEYTRLERLDKGYPEERRRGMESGWPTSWPLGSSVRNPVCRRPLARTGPVLNRSSARSVATWRPGCRPHSRLWPAFRSRMLCAERLIDMREGIRSH